MTRDDIIRLAREAGDDVEHTLPSDLDFLERFAALVAAAEREACEKDLDELRGSASMFATSKEARAHNNAVTCCVEAIRARGESDAP